MTSSLSIEGWRRRRRQPAARARALRAAVLGPGRIGRDVARRLAAARCAEVILSAATEGEASDALLDLGARVRHVIHLDRVAPVDVLVVCDPDPERVRDAALWAARTCPDTALVIAARDGLELSRQAARASGLTPYLILSPGGMPRAAIERHRVARALGVGASQVEVPVIGGDGYGATRPVWRYAAVGGIPLDQLLGVRDPSAQAPPEGEVPDGALAASAAALVRAILLDKRQVLCCGAWVEGAFGVPGGYVTAPFRVGARGAEEPLPLRLTLEERASLLACVRD